MSLTADTNAPIYRIKKKKGEGGGVCGRAYPRSKRMHGCLVRVFNECHDQQILQPLRKSKICYTCFCAILPHDNSCMQRCFRCLLFTTVCNRTFQRDKLKETPCTLHSRNYQLMLRDTAHWIRRVAVLGTRRRARCGSETVVRVDAPLHNLLYTMRNN